MIVAIARAGRTQLFLQIDDLRSTTSDRYADREELRFFSWAFTGYEGVLALSTEAAQLRYEPALRALKAEGNLPHASNVTTVKSNDSAAARPTAGEQSHLSLVNRPFRAAGIRSLAVVIGGEPAAAHSVIEAHLARETSVIFLPDPNRIGGYPGLSPEKFGQSSARLHIADSWRDVESLLCKHYDAFSRATFSNELSDAVASKQIRPLRRPVEKKFHPFKATHRDVQARCGDVVGTGSARPARAEFVRAFQARQQGDNSARVGGRRADSAHRRIVRVHSASDTRAGSR
jgi:hypothetical protein